MFVSNFDSSDAVVQSTDGLSATELMTTNWQTTAAVGLTVASGGVLGAISLAAFPAQTLATGATIGGLAYVGKRRADGLEPIPFLAKKDQDKAEAVPAAA